MIDDALEVFRVDVALPGRSPFGGSARWKDSSPREKEYLAGLSRLVMDESHPIGADVARALGEQSSAVPYPRARLLQKGTIDADGRTRRFAVPGMAAWIQAQTVG